MSTETTAILSLPYIQPAQAQKHVTHNEALKALDALVQLAVASRVVNAPPASPTEGARYIIGPAPTGAWAASAGKVAAWLDGVWEIFTPLVGWLAFVADEAVLVVRTSSGWNRPSQQGLDMLGINATADVTNRLALAAAASLFSHDGAGHQIKVNKNAVGDTGSVLFQTNWSGRAEFGLAGTDNFSVKVSADGSAWNTAILTDAASGLVATPAGLRLVPVLATALPAPAPAIAGSLRYVSDAPGGPQLAYCDGSAWLKVRDGLSV